MDEKMSSYYFLQASPAKESAEVAPMSCGGHIDPHHEDFLCVAERNSGGSLRYYSVSDTRASVRFCFGSVEDESAQKYRGRQVAALAFVPGVAGQVLFTLAESYCVFRANLRVQGADGRVACTPVGLSTETGARTSCFSSLWDGEQLYVAVGDEAGALRLWQAAGAGSKGGEDQLMLKVDGAHERESGGVTCVELMSDMVFTGGRDQSLNIWKIDGELLAKLDVQTEQVCSIVHFAVPSDNRQDTLDMLGVGTAEGNVVVYDLFRLAPHMVIESDCGADEDTAVVSICASHDGRAFAISYSNGVLSFFKTSSEPQGFSPVGRRVIGGAPLSCAYDYSPSRVGQFVVWQQHSGETMVWSNTVLPDDESEHKAVQGGTSTGKGNTSYVDSDFSELDDSIAEDSSNLPEPSPHPSQSQSQSQSQSRSRVENKHKGGKVKRAASSKNRQAPTHLRNPSKLYDILKQRVQEQENPADVEPSVLAQPSYNFTRRLMNTIDKSVQEQRASGATEAAVEAETEKRFREMCKIKNLAAEELSFKVAEAKYDALPSVEFTGDLVETKQVKKQVSKKWLQSLKHKPEIGDLRRPQAAQTRFTPQLPSTHDISALGASAALGRLWTFPQPQRTKSRFY
jgi:hypothetical protein